MFPVSQNGNMAKRIIVEDFYEVAKNRGLLWVGMGHPKSREHTEWKCPE
jgi:hypothetical protein